jgi:branched-chain amino acid transport system permease protein
LPQKINSQVTQNTGIIILDLTLIVLAIMDGISYAALVFMVAAGLTLIFGVMRILNVAHGALYAIGAYAAATAAMSVASAGMATWLQLPALLLSAVAIGTFLGAVIERHLFRHIYAKEEVIQLLVTFAVFMILEDVQRLVWGVEPYAAPDLVSLLGTVDVLNVPYMSYQVILLPACAIAVLVFLRWLLRHTLLGHLITATTEDRETAIAMGINANKVFFITFIIGAILAVIGGALAAPTTAVQLGMGAEMIVLSFAVVATAGLGQIGGAAIAAILLGLGRSFAVYTFPELEVLVPYLIMFIVLLIRPQGLFGEAETRKI